MLSKFPPRRIDHPQRKIGLEPMLLSTFFREVARVMFDEKSEEIVFPPKKLPNRDKITGATAKSLQIYEHISFALMTGDITCSAILKIPPRKKVDKKFISPAEDYEDDLLLDENEDNESDLSHRHYPISKSFWSEYWPENILDWLSSHALIHADHINVSDSKSYLAEFNLLGTLRSVRDDLSYRADQAIEAPVVVLRADLALRSLIPLQPIPNDVDGTRYAAFKNRLIDEIVAAAWRDLAITRPNEDEIRPKLFINIMRDYLIAQNINDDAIGISDGLLNVLATKLTAQWRERNTTSRVTLNSTPIRTQLRPKL